MAEQKLITKNQFAKLAGVHRTAVSKAMLEGALKNAAVDDRVDANHPDAVAYLKRDRKKRQKAAKSGARRKVDQPPKEASVSDKNGDGTPTEPVLTTDDGLDISRYADMTLRELGDRFGTMREKWNGPCLRMSKRNPGEESGWDLE